MASQSDIDAIVNESGNSFHCRAMNYLANKGWHNIVSPYYMDGGTNKPRELDVVSEKHWIFSDHITHEKTAVVVRLFMECKYILNPIVFWFGDKDMAAAKEWVSSNTPLPRNNIYTDRHHYIAGSTSVAKLFAGKNKGNPENEVIYRALNQALNAMVNLRGRQPSIPQLLANGISVKRVIEMPVVLCNSFSELYGIDMKNPTIAASIGNDFQLEINYAYLDAHGEALSEYFLLDIVDFERVDRYLDAIEKDIAAVFEIL